MNKAEKQVLKTMYIDKLESFKLFEGSEHGKVIEIELDTIDNMIKQLLPHAEYIELKNEAYLKVYYNNSSFLKDMLQNTVSWMKQIEKEVGERQYLFTLTEKGIRRLHAHYSWLKGEEKYKGFFGSIEMIRNELIKVS